MYLQGYGHWAFGLLSPWRTCCALNSQWWGGEAGGEAGGSAYIYITLLSLEQWHLISLKALFFVHLLFFFSSTRLGSARLSKTDRTTQKKEKKEKKKRRVQTGTWSASWLVHLHSTASVAHTRVVPLSFFPPLHFLFSYCVTWNLALPPALPLPLSFFSCRRRVSKNKFHE